MEGIFLEIARDALEKVFDFEVEDDIEYVPEILDKVFRSWKDALDFIGLLESAGFVVEIVKYTVVAGSTVLVVKLIVRRREGKVIAN